MLPPKQNIISICSPINTVIDKSIWHSRTTNLGQSAARSQTAWLLIVNSDSCWRHFYVGSTTTAGLTYLFIYNGSVNLAAKGWIVTICVTSVSTFRMSPSAASPPSLVPLMKGGSGWTTEPANCNRTLNQSHLWLQLIFLLWQKRFRHWIACC